MNTIEKIGYVSAIAAASYMGGIVTANIDSTSAENSTVIVHDLNADGMDDVIVRTEAGREYVHLAQKDGTYVAFEDVLRRENMDSRAYVDSVRQSIDNKVEELYK